MKISVIDTYLSDLEKTFDTLDMSQVGDLIALLEKAHIEGRQIFL